jgi:hypothetical protein
VIQALVLWWSDLLCRCAEWLLLARTVAGLLASADAGFAHRPAPVLLHPLLVVLLPAEERIRAVHAGCDRGGRAGHAQQLPAVPLPPGRDGIPGLSARRLRGHRAAGEAQVAAARPVCRGQCLLGRPGPGDDVAWRSDHAHGAHRAWRPRAGAHRSPVGARGLRVRRTSALEGHVNSAHTRPHTRGKTSGALCTRTVGAQSFPSTAPVTSRDRAGHGRGPW